MIGNDCEDLFDTGGVCGACYMRVDFSIVDLIEAQESGSDVFEGIVVVVTATVLRKSASQIADLDLFSKYIMLVEH